MSVLRFLSPGRYSRPSSPSSSSRSRTRGGEPLQPRLSIRVPSFGSVFMDASHQGLQQPPDDLSTDPDNPGSTEGEGAGSSRVRDRESRGELEIEIPLKMGRIKVKAIRVGMKTETELTIGKGREGEKDVIFERKVEALGGEEGIILEPGLQRFDFVLLIPSNLCSHDRHPNGRIRHGLYAELEGIEPDSTQSTETQARGGRSHSRKPTKRSTSTTPHSHSQSHSRSRSPLPPPRPSFSQSQTSTGSGSPSANNLSASASAAPSGTATGTATPRYPDSPEELPSDAINAQSLATALSMSMSLTRHDSDTCALSEANFLHRGRPGPSHTAASVAHGASGGVDISGAPPPGYAESSNARGSSSSAAPKNSEDGPTWLVGNVRKERYMELLYNCHPQGGITELDVVVRDAVPGLGPFEVNLESDCWTIGALLFGNLKLLAPSADVTVFSFKVSLIQTHAILSPRDDPATTQPTRTTQIYPIFVAGTRPLATEPNPGPRVPALWRGTEAKGKDEGEIVIKGRGRNPKDSIARPSSVPNVPTPITVTHKIAVEVLFSVWGQDEQGNRLPLNGPGSVRALMIEKGTMVASCAYTPEELRLPSYGTIPFNDAFSHLARKCPLCGKDPPDKLCQTCPQTALPHPRHDHPPKLVGNDNGICPLCAEEIIPRREPNFQDCACGMSDEYLLARFESRQSAGTRSGGGGSGGAIRGGLIKEEVERGRRL